MPSKRRLDYETTKDMVKEKTGKTVIPKQLPIEPLKPIEKKDSTKKGDK